MMEGAELKAYLDRNYGSCKLEKCRCKDPHAPRFGGEWVGIMCPDWVPTGASTWEELREFVIKEKQGGR